MTHPILPPGQGLTSSAPLAVSGMLTFLLLGSYAAAEPALTATSPPQAAPTVVAPEVESSHTLSAHETWHSNVQKAPLPNGGCFKAVEPSNEWQEVPCVAPPERPYLPISGSSPDTVGNGSDFSAQVTGAISSAIGSFPSVVGVGSEVGGSAGAANSFSLQLNTNTFKTPACSGAATPASCSGWEQFVYSNSGLIFTQYWLLNYAHTCPSGWNTFGSDCWRNAASAASVPVQSITDLGKLSITAKAVSGGQDTAIMTVGGTAFTESNPDNTLDLAASWTIAEFNIFGDCCSSQANFNGGAKVEVRVQVNNGTTNQPTCTTAGFTGETNNLTINGACVVAGGPSPSISFTESIAPTPDLDSIWRSTGAGCTTATNCPGWAQLDDNGQSVRLRRWRRQSLPTAQHWKDLAFNRRTLCGRRLPRLGDARRQPCVYPNCRRRK